jgi:CBS domain-containing protein
MPPADSVQRVRIYLSRDDQWEGGARYLAILEQLRRSGASGATVLQGLAGFGPGQRSRPSAPDRPDQHAPVVVEWVDRVERVARLLPLLDALVADALVTVEDIPIYRAMLRPQGPFAADNTVGDVMRQPAPAILADAPLSAAIALMRERQLGTLPVTNGAGQLVGLITPQELAWRAGLRLPLALLDRLTPAERDAILAPLLGRDAQAIMNIEPRSVSASTSLPQALVTMVEWGYTQVAIVDRQGVLLGLLGEDDVLRAAVEQPGTDDGAAVRDAEPPVTVALVMQRVLAQGGAGQRLAQALPQLLAAPEQDLLVLDDEGRLAGALTAAAALDALPAEGRAAFLAAIQRQQMSMGGAPAGDLTLAQLLDPATPTIGAGATLREAARRLLELGVERLAVVAADRSLLGIIARGGLVRALMQQSD